MEELYIKDSATHRGVPIIRDESYKTLINIVKQISPKQILEIGTAVGYSGMAMLKNCGAHLTTIEHEKNLIAEASENFTDSGLADRVTLVCDDCLVQVAQMVADDKYNNFYDFIFLDGPKAQYDNMLDGLIMLLAPGGTLLVDNVLFRGYVYNPQLAPNNRFKTICKRLSKFIDRFLAHQELTNAKLINQEDGMLIAQKVQN